MRSCKTANGNAHIDLEHVALQHARTTGNIYSCVCVRVQGVVAVKFAAGFMDLQDVNVDEQRILRPGGGEYARVYNIITNK